MSYMTYFVALTLFNKPLVVVLPIETIINICDQEDGGSRVSVGSTDSYYVRECATEVLRLIRQAQQ